jgi:peptide deformylase
MIQAMYDYDGIGLAAPQIGLSTRVIIVETSVHPKRKKDPSAKETEKSIDSAPQNSTQTLQGKPMAFLNPKIEKKSKETSIEEEGCLSLPGIFVPVKRSESIELVCQTPQGEEIKIQAAGLTARIFQHEVDHLNGKLIINHITPMERYKLRKQLKELRSKDK